ncbi:MAG: nucleotide exchange factor GrpE [Firmicutes bacterium]|nr:nucleotide exchange factor GrpE [Alicyclobacillaceae bacterium]MCL6496946.1 nucleotide exchange factor GrpE [Bacillota bacterium]
MAEEERQAEPGAPGADGLAAEADGVPEGPMETAPAEPAPDWEQVAKERYDQLVRLQADFENFRRRVERDREELQGQITGMVVLALLPVYDNLDRALKLMPNEGEAKAWRTGVEMTFKGFEEVLARLGVTPIPSVGQMFDPRYHEAVQREEGDAPEGQILEELARGFTWRDRVIRAALVKVSAGRPAAKPSDEA